MLTLTIDVLFHTLNYADKATHKSEVVGTVLIQKISYNFIM